MDPEADPVVLPVAAVVEVIEEARLQKVEVPLVVKEAHYPKQMIKVAYLSLKNFRELGWWKRQDVSRALKTMIYSCSNLLIKN